MKTTILARACAAFFLAASLVPAHAVDLRPDGASVTFGYGEGTHLAGVGLIWDWNFMRLRPDTQVTAHGEVILNRWTAVAVGDGHSSYGQIVLLPTIRMRMDQGGSPWFLEAGIGASWLDRTFRTPEREFGSQWNFYDVLGLGYTFGGVGGHHEVGMRLVHVSNGGFSTPNPGQDFVQLRYVNWF